MVVGINVLDRIGTSYKDTSYGIILTNMLCISMFFFQCDKLVTWLCQILDLLRLLKSMNFQSLNKTKKSSNLIIKSNIDQYNK